jgi:hypothetical protein
MPELGPTPITRPDFFAGLPQPLQALELLAAYYGVIPRTLPRESDLSPAGTALACGAYPGQRAGILISNTGANPVAVGFTPAVTLTTGIAIIAGYALELNFLTDLQLVNYPLWVIAAGGSTSTVHVVENVFAGG